MATGNLAQQYGMAPLPIPEAPKPSQQETPDPRLDPNNQPQMPQVYRGGKAGGAAYIADKVLTGWLAGAKIAKERQAQQMTNEVSGAKTGLDFIGQAYRAAVDSGDPARIKQAETALTEAYNDYLNKAEKYALPDSAMGKDGKPKKPGIGQRFKEAFTGGPTPNDGLARSTLEIMRKADPRELFGQSKAEKQQAEMNDITLQRERMGLASDKRKEAATKNYEAALATDPAKRTEDQNKTINFYEQFYMGKSREQLVKDDLLDKVSRGVQLDPNQRQLAEAYGLVKPNVTSTTIHTTVDEKGRPYSEIVSIGPDGKIVGQPQRIPGRDYVPPDQADIATKMIDGQVSALIRVAKKAHPEWDDQTAYQFALASVAPASAGQNWFMQNQQADVMNRAINAVMQKHASKHKDANGNEIQSYDQVGDFAKQALVSAGDDGRYYYLPQLGVKPETSGGSHWYNLWMGGPEKTTVLGLSPEEAQKNEAQFRAELRAELKRQNSKIPDSELDKILPPAITRAGMAPAPAPSASNNTMTPPPQQNAAGMLRTSVGNFTRNQKVMVGGQVQYVVGVDANGTPVVSDSPSE